MWKVDRDGVAVAVLLLPVITFVRCSASGAVSNGSGGNSGGSSHLETFTERGGSNQNTYLDSAYRHLDTQLLRIGSRLDQLMMRMDHLDSRVGRVQSTGHLRFDSIETSMQTTRQRMDLWSNQLNLIEEQLTRKWKNMESRFDSLVSTLDSKLDTKFNLIQRDNRRHNEFISQSFNTVFISQSKMRDQVESAISEMNSTLSAAVAKINDSTTVSKSYSSMCLTRVDKLIENISSSSFYPPPYPQPVQYSYSNSRRNVNAIQPSEQLAYPRPYNSPTSSHESPTANSSLQLISTKVSNMFDELVKRSLDLEAIVKDSFTMSNKTRQEVQDGFTALIPIMSQLSMGSGLERSSGSSGEVMSLMVDTASSVQHMATSLGRKITELQKRYEFVAMTLNGFMESCLRIQDRGPTLEMRISDALDRIVDYIDNSTRNATEAWEKVKSELLSNINPINVTNCTKKLITTEPNPLFDLLPTTTPTSVKATPPQELPGDRNDTDWDSLLREYDEEDQNEYESNTDLPRTLGQATPVNHQHHHHLTRHHQHRLESNPNNEQILSHHENSRLSERERRIWENLSALSRQASDDENVPE